MHQKVTGSIEKMDITCFFERGCGIPASLSHEKLARGVRTASFTWPAHPSLLTAAGDNRGIRLSAITPQIQIIVASEMIRTRLTMEGPP